MLLDPTGKMYLAELYKGLIENVMRDTISDRIKNKNLSGDPQAGTLVAKRFQDDESEEYGTARSAGKGQSVKGKEVKVDINKDKEFVKEIEQKDIKLSGVEGLLEKMAAKHKKGLARELDVAFFAEAAVAGTTYTAPTGVTEVADILEDAAVTLSSLKTKYVDGVPRDMMSFQLSPAYYSAVRKYLDTVPNSNVDTAAGEFKEYHGVIVQESVHLPSGTNFILQVDESIAQPVMANTYQAERIGLSEAYAVSLFFHYGTKAVTPELILVG